MQMGWHLNNLIIFRSMDEQIDLVPLDQFYKEAPEKISKAVRCLPCIWVQPV